MPKGPGLWYWSQRSPQAKASLKARLEGGVLNEAPGAYGALDIDVMHSQRPYRLMMAEIERKERKQRE